LSVRWRRRLTPSRRLNHTTSEQNPKRRRLVLTTSEQNPNTRRLVPTTTQQNLDTRRQVLTTSEQNPVTRRLVLTATERKQTSQWLVQARTELHEPSHLLVHTTTSQDQLSRLVLPTVTNQHEPLSRVVQTVTNQDQPSRPLVHTTNRQHQPSSLLLLPATIEVQPSPIVDQPAALVLASSTLVKEDTPDAVEPVAPVIGTDRLGRPFTTEERKHFAKLLRDNHFLVARRYALCFGIRLTGRGAEAEDLVQRACERLVRWGWDPNEVPLKARLCRLVWSEWTHEKRERATARRAEAGFVREMQATAPSIHVRQDSGRMLTVNVARTPEDHAERLEEERQEEAEAETQLDKVRAAFVKAKDSVNLLWLGYTLEGKTDLQEMARMSARNVTEFYDAAKRRKRIVARLAAEAQGVTYEKS